MQKAASSCRPSQFLVSVAEPGIGGKIGYLDQNVLAVENFCNMDPDIDHYKEIS